MIKISRVYSLLKQGKRSNLEDYIYPSSPQLGKIFSRIYIVCDGVGGETKGEIASKLVAETFGEMLSSMSNITREDIINVLEKATLRIKEYIDVNPEAINMSTTLTMAVINSNEILLAWCGDSKIIHFNAKEIKWKSLDHSLVQHLININEISIEEAKKHPQRNVITRCVNKDTQKEDLDFQVISKIENGDYLMLATDGIFEYMEISNLPHIAQDKQVDKSELIDAYCSHETRDNYSMYLLSINKPKNPKLLKTLLLLISIMLLAGVLSWHVDRAPKRKKQLPTLGIAKQATAQIPIIIENDTNKTLK